METFERKPGTFRRKWGRFCAEVARCADGLRAVKEKQEGETKKREPSQANETIPEGKDGDDRPMVRRSEIRQGNNQASSALTFSLMVRPSARPARRLEATPMTLPISLGEVAPTSAMISRSAVVSSSSVRALGR